MTTHDALHHDAIGNLPVLGSVVPGVAQVGSRVVALARRVFDGLKKALHQDSAEEVYLSQALDIADLERRMLTLQRPDKFFSGRQW